MLAHSARMVEGLDVDSFVVFRSVRNIPKGIRLAHTNDNPDCLRLCRDGFDCSDRASGKCPFTHIQFNSTSDLQDSLESDLLEDSDDSRTSSDIHLEYKMYYGPSDLLDNSRKQRTNKKPHRKKAMPFVPRHEPQIMSFESNFSSPPSSQDSTSSGMSTTPPHTSHFFY
eukprot:gb/GEZN01012809.1/.p1 GENE.gb/GEZN01012809.1/~~gb/GEZN01012809.1/.p1  ORF type:complete len:169 (-),score=2.51 gb/GEZN01012809.1/:514-1020(-)